MSTLIGLMLALLAAVLPPGGTFIDDDASIHQGSIEAIAAEGITRGCDPPANHRFCPDETVTRGQMAAFLARALHLGSGGDDRFTDDTGHTFEREINAIAGAGITLGCNPPANDRFCPDGVVTRAQMAAMLVRAFDYPIGPADRFLDDDETKFEDDIDALGAAEITFGCNPPANDRFCPDEEVTREQMASFLTRALQLTPMSPPPRRGEAVPVSSRESWGARPPDLSLMTEHTINRLTVHHAGSQTGTTGAAQFRGWQNFHIDGRGWGDLAYHVIIGIDGTVYEGRDRRYRGDTGTSYDTTGHFLVVVEGNFDTDTPTEAQIRSLTNVLAWASEEYGVSPSTISGHRDHAATSCPGTHLAAIIDSGELRRSVEQAIAAGGADLVWP